MWEGLSSVESAERAESEGDALGALVGRARAAILARLDVPMTTTALARELGQSAGTVSTHLSILRACGLLTSWRAGRSVLYRRTPLAASVLAASGSPISDEQLA
ncbi:MAG: ArsR/SmtB family transcription factor [Kribbellaceae bacterium]